MTLTDAALIAQIAGVLLVIPSILYLAFQIHQNTKQLKAAARYQFVEATGQINAVMAGDKSAASVFRRGISDYASLDEDERWQFLIIIGQHLQIHSVMFELYEDGLLPETQWHNVRKDILSIVRSDGGKRIWEEFGKGGLDAKFVAYVERASASAEATYDMTKI
ncbi:MAG: hypothetical protein WD076_08170 [Parvularculaceae bacterium]